MGARAVAVNGGKKVIMFWHMALGAGHPYVHIIWSKMLLSVIDKFHPMVGGVVAGATLNALLMCASSVSYTAYVACCVVVVLLALEGRRDTQRLLTHVWYDNAVDGLDFREFWNYRIVWEVE